MQFYLFWLVGILLVVGFLQGVKCSLSGLSPHHAGSHIPVVFSFPFLSQGILQCSCPTSRVQWLCTLCVPTEGIPGLGGSVSSLLLGGTVPLWLCPALLPTTTLCWEGFF